MCGIIGLARGQAAGQVAPLLATLRHRGPDGANLWCDEHHTLGHTRLSIIDLAGGSQPMSDAKGSLCVTYNGEIYNHRTLRAARGTRPFRTQCDTEILLALAGAGDSIERWVKQLDGMFAFALIDGDELMLARDPLGIKPLYWGKMDGAIAFASEIKGLSGHATEIAEFPAGYVFHTRTGLQQYYSIPASRPRLVTVREAKEGIVRRLHEAVRKRLMADVPVGVFLSGGLDSSIIAALAIRQMAPLETFAVGTHHSEDRQRARQVAKYLGTRHHEYIFDIREAIESLPEVIYHLESFDCALVRSAIPNYFLARLASAHVKVALSGEGADELYAGYEYLKKLPTHELDRELREITGELHNTNLQRCDRMSMAHGLEVRVPFLDIEMVDHAFGLPVSMKQCGPQRVEKWILRVAAEDLLPAPIAWRAKAKFAAGSGLGAELAAFAEQQISPAEFEREREVAEGLLLRSREELLYFRLFKQMYPQSEVLQLVGRSHSV